MTRTAPELDAGGQRINAGVGVVTPYERILEALEMPEFSEDRKRIEKKHEETDEDGATLDTGGL